MDRLKDDENFNGIFALWLSWMMSTGALLVVMLAPLWMRPLWIPFLAVVLEVVLFSMIRYQRQVARSPRCQLMMFVSSRILLWSAVAMILVLFYHHDLPADRRLSFGINTDIPFIPILIISPIGVLVSLWMLRQGSKFPFCVDCKLRYDSPAERGFLGTLFTQEGAGQVRFLLWGQAIISVIGWGYYLLKYVNASLNDADRYFFFILPATIWFFATAYLTLRYLGIWRYYDQDLPGSSHRTGSYTKARFLIVNGNSILLSCPEPDEADGIVDLMRTRFDTPAQITLPFRRNFPPDEAPAYLESILPTKNARTRFLYSNTEWNVDCNIFHYIVNVTDEDAQHLADTIPGARWLTLGDFNRALAAGELEPLLASEIHRIYTAAMAFKTYDARGRRLYPIKHYHPTFRLCDVIDYKLDYNDRHWLYVAHCNQDQPFYRLRSFWRRHIQGLTY